MVKKPPVNAGDLGDAGLIPGLGRFPGGVHGNPLQYLCLENPMDRGAWGAKVHGVAKSWTRRSDSAHTHLLRAATHCQVAIRIQLLDSLHKYFLIAYYAPALSRPGDTAVIETENVPSPRTMRSSEGNRLTRNK